MKKTKIKYFKILCALSLITILSIFFMNKCNAQTFVDTTQQNKNIILEEFTGIRMCFLSSWTFNWTKFTRQ